MASNPDFVQYIADQCAGAGEITVKKMFGDYGIYCDGIIIGLICGILPPIILSDSNRLNYNVRLFKFLRMISLYTQHSISKHRFKILWSIKLILRT